MEGTIEQVIVGEATWCVVHGESVSVGTGAPAQIASVPTKSIDVVLTDPPYSEAVHKNARTGRWKASLPDVAEQPCRQARGMDFGFDCITEPEMRGLAAEIERTTRRWAGIFSDVESCHVWRSSFVTWEYIRTCEWRRIGGAPQFTGDRPASSFEAITLMHPKGRKRWNGGGKAGAYEFPIVANRLGERGSRIHPTQKPLELMMALVEDFSDPGEIIGDWYAGSGTTGAAAIRLGRRFIGIEKSAEHVETARERLRAEESGSTYAARILGQTALFSPDVTARNGGGR